MKKRIIFINIIIFIILAGCVSNNGESKPKEAEPGDAELIISLDQYELILNETSITGNITIVNQLNQKINMGRVKTGINITNLDESNYSTLTVGGGGGDLILDSKEERILTDFIIDTQRFGLKTGNYSVIASFRTIESNIEYFNVIE